MKQELSRFSLLVGDESIKRLSSKTVIVIGVGGVGGYVVEGLVRSGIGNIIIVDYDTVDITNINRQIIATRNTLGKKKVDVLENRIKSINRDCNVVKIDEFINKDNIDILFNYKVDYLVDCCDTITTKKEIILKCIENNIPFITSMGTGNKFDPSKLEICDIRKTINDPIARIIRKFVKDKKIKSKVMCLSSTELPCKIKSRTPGSTAFVPSSAGLLISSYIVRKFLDIKI